MMYCVLMHDVMCLPLMVLSPTGTVVSIREVGAAHIHTYLTLGDLAPDVRCRPWEVAP